MLVHFKIETCSSVDPVSVAERIFTTGRHLVVLHKGKNENPHWHFQGETEIPGKELDALIKEFCTNHSKYIKSKAARPAKRVKGDVTELGYQYMLKEDPPIVVSQNGFTEEDISELHQKSQDHVDSLKNQLRDYLYEIEDRKPCHNYDPKEAHRRWRHRGIEYYINADKMPPPNFQKLLIWYMIKRFQDNRVFRNYLSSKI